MSRRSLRKSGRYTRAALIEALEERRLLYDYTFNGTNNGESIVAQMVGGGTILQIGIIGQAGLNIPSPAGKTVLLSALGGNDTIFLNDNGGAIITVNAGEGDDTIQLGGGSSQNLSNLPGNSILAGGGGFDTVLAQDGNNPVAFAYTVTDSRFDRAGWGGFYYEADIERLTLYTTSLSNTVNVHSTWPSQPVRIFNRGGADTVFIGNGAQGVQGIRAHVFVEGVGTNSIYINNNGDTVARSANIDWDVTSSWGALNSLAPFPIIWQNAVTTQVTVTTGTAADTILINRNSSPLVLNSAGGNDTVQIGSQLVNGLTAITAPVTIENNPAYSNLSIINAGDFATRVWTIDSANGYGSLTGMAPATISWDNADIASISLMCGGGIDDGLILRLSETLNINNSSGVINDQIQIGNLTDSGMQQITGAITIDNDPAYTNLIFQNEYDETARTATLDFVNGYNVLSGLAPATIRYDDADTHDVSIRMGFAANTFNLLRTATAGGRTFIDDFGGQSSVRVGNPTNGLQSIQATLWIDSVLDVTLDNRADTVARNITMAILSPTSPWTQVTGLAPVPILYHCAVAFGSGELASLQLLGGSGGNAYTISGSSDTGAFRKITRLDTGPGDVVTVNTTNMPSWAESRIELIDPVASLASLSIQDGASVVLTGAANQVLVTGSISITGTGALDVRDKAVIVNYTGATPIEPIRAGVSSGFNGGAWTGAGINSSTAASTAGTAVGFAEATDLFSTFPATFAGQSIDNTSILLRHTLNGDTNLDRNTNLVDFNRLAANFGQPLRRWSTGDFSFDAIANLADFNLLASQLGNILGPDGFGQSPIGESDDPQPPDQQQVELA